MKKAKFIINPTSGKQNFLKNIEGIVGCLVMNQVVNTVDVIYTRKQYDARNEAKAMLPGEYDFVVAVGGDGTLNDVINGVIEGGSQTPVAVISAGTVNDFATYMHLPQGREDFCKMIMDFKTQEIDIGKINDEYFVNVVAGGLWADIGYKVPKESKAVLGKMAYYIEGAKDLPMGMTSHRLKIEAEEFSQSADVVLFVVTNSGSVGGFRQLVPGADVSDGYLDVLAIKKGAFGQLADLPFKLMQGEHLNHPQVIYFKTKGVSITSAENGAQTLPVDYDGELFGELPVHLKVLPKAIKLLVPLK